MATVLPRSFLYVPADRPDLFPKAASGPADAVVLDLEDAVPVSAKSAARAEVAEWLGSLGSAGPGGRPEQWVRVDADNLGPDLEAVVCGGLDGVFLAKCTVDALDEAAGRLDALEQGRRPGDRPVRVVGLVESGRGLTELAAMAAHPRLLTFGVGETDLLADLRMARSASTTAAVDLLRVQIVVACAAAQIAAPVAPTSTAFRDLDGFRESTRHLRDLGFRSRTAIHPGQVPVIHEILTPADDEVARARDIVDRFAAARGGVTTDVDGHLIDAAVVRGARETVDLRDAADHRPR